MQHHTAETCRSMTYDELRTLLNTKENMDARAESRRLVRMEEETHKLRNEISELRTQLKASKSHSSIAIDKPKEQSTAPPIAPPMVCLIMLCPFYLFLCSI